MPGARLTGTLFAPVIAFDAIPVPNSPSWHRRARSSRSKWRAKIHQERFKNKPRLGLIQHPADKLHKHHSKPLYKESMGKDWNQWSQWPSRQAPKSTEKNKGGKGKGKQQLQQAGKDKLSMPGYDAQSSPASSSVEPPTDALRSALVDILAENNLQIPEKYKHFVEPDITDQINQDQKALNTKERRMLASSASRRLWCAKTSSGTSFELLSRNIFSQVLRRRFCNKPKQNK